MPRFDGSLALKLDFGQITTAMAARGELVRPRLHLAAAQEPDKYKLLEHRRRQAQIKARRLLDLMEGN